MGWPSTPEYNTSFYQMSRHAEIVVTRDRDCFAFFPDMIPKDSTPMAGIWRDSAKTLPQWTSGSGTLTASERTLLWARVSGDGLVSGFRCVPYVTSDDIDDTDIAPFREVYAPRVVYDRESNSLHLWFWTNVNWAYNGTAYTEAEIYKIGAKDYDQAIGTGFKKCKKVLCYAVGHFEHLYVEGGWVGSFVGQPGSTAQYDMIPIFSRPKIITNYAPTPDDSANGSGLITDGWYPAVDKFPFQLVRSAPKTLGMRCGYRCRNGIFAEALEGIDGVGGPSHDLNDLWTHTFSGATTVYMRLRFRATGSPEYNSPEAYMNTALIITLETSDPTGWVADPFHRDLCVGKIDTDMSGDITTIEQWWHGGNEDDTAVVPDTNSTAAYNGYPAADTSDPAPNPTRSTIQIYNAGGGSHRNELQLYGVDTVPLNTITFPYFESEAALSPASNQLKGVLKWAVLDSQNTKASADYKSLGLRADVLLPPSGKQVLEIYGFQAATGHAAPYRNQSATPAKIEWRYPVKGGAMGAPGSANTYCLDAITLITVTHDNGTNTPIPSYPVGSWANCGTVTLAFTANRGHVAANGDGTGTVLDPASGSAGSATFDMWLKAVPDHKHQHTTLGYDVLDGPDATKQANTDHDWRYWIQGDSRTSCYGTTIGFGTGTHSTSSLRIDLGPCQLTSGASVYVDWDDMQLQNGGSVRADWGLGHLNNASAAIVAKWFTGELTLAGGATTLNWLTQTLTGGGFWNVAASTLFKVLDTTDATSYLGNSGALQVLGGASIQKHLYVGGNATSGGLEVCDNGNFWHQATGVVSFQVYGASVSMSGLGASGVYIESGANLQLKFGTGGSGGSFTVLNNFWTIISHDGTFGIFGGPKWTASPTTFDMNPTNMQYASQPAVDGVQVRLQPTAGGSPINVWIRKGGITST